MTTNNIRKRSIFSVSIVAIGLFSAMGIQYRDNERIARSCDPSIYVIGVTETGVGPVYRCLSRAVAYGPTPPLPQ